MSRWTEEDLQKWRAKHEPGRLGGMGALAPHDLPAAGGEQATARRVATPRGESPLELELAGHLRVMGIPAERQYQFHPDRKWRFDFAYPAELVLVDIDGGIFAAENGRTAGRHARGAGILSGFEKKNAAVELGFFVLSYGPPQIKSGEAALQIERIVASRRAVGGLALVRELDGTVEQSLEEQHARKPRVNRRR